MFLLFTASTVYYHQVILLKSTNYTILRYQNTATDNSYINKDNIIMSTRQQKLNKTKLTTKKVSCPFTFPLMFEVYFIFQTNFSSSLYPIARALGLSLLHLTFVKMICTIHTVGYMSSTLKLQMKVFHKVQTRKMKVTRTAVCVERHFAMKPHTRSICSLLAETVETNFLSLYNLRK